MKNVMKRIQNSKGFVSLEFIMIAGIVIVLASVILVLFNNEASTMGGNAVTQLEDANRSMEPTSTTP